MKNYEIEVIRSNRKSIGLQIKEPGKLIVRAPYRATNTVIREVIESHVVWIENAMERVEAEAKQNQESAARPFTEDELWVMRERAKEIFPKKVKHYAELIGVTYGRITIRKQKTVWGSCAANGNLNFNCLLVMLPDEVIDYVVVHELCHRLEMNHSKAFWAEVEKVLPDYKERRKVLRTLGEDVMRRA